MLSKPKKISRLMLFELKKFSQLMLSKPKKFSRPTIILIYFFGILLIVYTLRPLFWTGGTGISDTLDKIFWGDTKRSETVVSKTVETDKQGNTVKTIETIKYDDGKTLWDWGSLLGVPLSLAILGYFLQQQQQKRAEKLSEDQRKIADNETKEEVLQTYFDRLSVLLIDRNLIALSNKSNSSTITPEEQELLDSSLDVIRARTLSILRRFKNDAERKTSVINFLIETEIIGTSKVNLQGAERKTSIINFLIETEIVGKSKLNLQGADLSGANLQGAYLQGAYLQGANLQGADLREAKLRGADLSTADLQGAKLQGAKLQRAYLQGAKLQGANLREAELQGAKLQGADLSTAKLQGADLSTAKLQRADLQGADLQRADLQGAKLQGADLSMAELQRAILRGAILEGADLEGANLQGIQGYSMTKWPDKSAFNGAINIPPDLKIKLGITP